MAQDNFTARGHSEFGNFVAGPADTSWGRTSPEGFGITPSVESVDLEVAQALNAVDTAIVNTGLSAQAEMVETDLSNLNRALGQPAGNFTEPGGAVLEQVDITDVSLGATEYQLYSLGAGPVGPRRIEMYKCRLANMNEIRQQKRDWTRLNVTYRMLTPSSGPIARFQDLP